MNENINFDVIIVGGSYSGLSAALALGRSLQKVLIIDSGAPCNRQTPHSHNFLTQDGKAPAEIAATAMEQVLKYPTVSFLHGAVAKGVKKANSFEVETASGQLFIAKKLLFATGVVDLMPSIKGFTECWGISVLHCPYCHGYEVRSQPLAILGNGEVAFQFIKLISNWSKNLMLLTNGKSTLSLDETEKMKSRNFQIVEDEILEIEHSGGYIQNLVFKNGHKQKLSAIFARIPFRQHTEVPFNLGCELLESGLFKVDEFQRTTVPGVFAAGDNSSLLRSVSSAIAAGTKAGAVINKELIDEAF